LVKRDLFFRFPVGVIAVHRESPAR
jgi:hypothetical protein